MDGLIAQPQPAGPFRLDERQRDPAFCLSALFAVQFSLYATQNQLLHRAAPQSGFCLELAIGRIGNVHRGSHSTNHTIFMAVSPYLWHGPYCRHPDQREGPRFFVRETPDSQALSLLGVTRNVLLPGHHSSVGCHVLVVLFQAVSETMV